MLTKFKQAEKYGSKKELENLKEEARINRALTYRQMDGIIGRCDHAIAQLENPQPQRPYEPNKYDEQRMKAKGIAA